MMDWFISVCAASCSPSHSADYGSRSVHNAEIMYINFSFWDNLEVDSCILESIVILQPIKQPIIKILEAKLKRQQRPQSAQQKRDYYVQDP